MFYYRKGNKNVFNRHKLSVRANLRYTTDTNCLLGQIYDTRQTQTVC